MEPPPTTADAPEPFLDRILAAVDGAVPPPPGETPRPPAGLTADAARDLLVDALRSNRIDVRSAALGSRRFYSIPSLGHELNAVVGAITEPTDPAFLHYRSGGFVMARSRRAGVPNVVDDVVVSLRAGAEDPIAGGRHKVWGSRPAWIVPQTSTIGSHPPKATGTAIAIERARRLARPLPVPADAIVVCSFGDASANHATTLAGINAARYAHRRGVGAPVLFVCEDNGLGISTPTPSRWIARTFGELPHLRYVHAGGEVDDVWT